MHDGKVVQSGTFGEFLHHPADAFVTSFINAQRTVPDAATVAA